MKFSSKFLFFLAAIVAMSCSRKEDPIGSVDVPLAITLTSDAGADDFAAIGVNTTVDFMVSGNDGADYTDLSRILVNGQDIFLKNLASFWSEQNTKEWLVIL